MSVVVAVSPPADLGGAGCLSSRGAMEGGVYSRSREGGVPSDPVSQTSSAVEKWRGQPDPVHAVATAGSCVHATGSRACIGRSRMLGREAGAPVEEGGAWGVVGADREVGAREGRHLVGEETKGREVAGLGVEVGEGRRAVLFRSRCEFGPQDLKIDVPCLSWVRGAGAAWELLLGGAVGAGRPGCVGAVGRWCRGLGGLLCAAWPGVFAVRFLSGTRKAFCLPCRFNKPHEKSFLPATTNCFPSIL